MYVWKLHVQPILSHLLSIELYGFIASLALPVSSYFQVVLCLRPAPTNTLQERLCETILEVAGSLGEKLAL